MNNPIPAASILLAMGSIGLVIYGITTKEMRSEEALEVAAEQAVEQSTPLNGVFSCTYHKLVTHTLSGINSYEITPLASGWNWVFITEEQGAVFFTQTAGQFCYVHHVGEE